MRLVLRGRLLLLASAVLISGTASAADHAEIPSKRVLQRYFVTDTTAVLERGDIGWVIRLWACDPAT